MRDSRESERVRWQSEGVIVHGKRVVIWLWWRWLLDHRLRPVTGQQSGEHTFGQLAAVGVAPLASWASPLAWRTPGDPSGCHQTARPHLWQGRNGDYTGHALDVARIKVERPERDVLRVKLLNDKRDDVHLIRGFNFNRRNPPPSTSFRMR